jgi:hypothetical protein
MSEIKLYKKKRFWLLIFFVIIFILILTREQSYTAPFVVLDDVDSSPVTGASDGFAVVEEEGWSRPVKLPVSDEGREDSTFITKDGRFILFYHDPGVGVFAESAGEENPNDPKIYYSERPFVTKEVHPISTDDFNAEAGPSISDNGDIYYTKTFIKLLPKPHEAMPRKTVVNNGKRVIDMGTGVAEDNPFYCDATRELYAEATFSQDPVDQDIVVYKDGKLNYLSAPINSKETTDFQAFLTEDCQTMYFTSSRGATQSIFPFQIYKSKRLGEFEWSEPEIFVSFPINNNKLGGVGEFTMTRDGKQMVFTELVITEVGGEYHGQNDIYYSEFID